MIKKKKKLDFFFFPPLANFLVNPTEGDLNSKTQCRILFYLIKINFAPIYCHSLTTFHLRADSYQRVCA